LEDQHQSLQDSGGKNKQEECKAVSLQYSVGSQVYTQSMKYPLQYNKRSQI